MSRFFTFMIKSRPYYISAAYSRPVVRRFSPAFRVYFRRQSTSSSFVRFDESNHESIASPAASKKNKELEPMNLAQLNEFDRLLFFLRNDIEFNKTSTLFAAPFLARRADVDRRKLFVTFGGKWWSQAERELRRQDFAVDYILNIVADLNRECDGELLRKMGAEQAVDFLLGRWLDMGFERFTFHQTLHAFSGLRRLCQNVSYTFVVERFRISRWDEFFKALERYCVKKHEKCSDDESRWITRFDFGGSCLMFFRQMDVVPSDDTLRCLNAWSLKALSYFDQQKLDTRLFPYYDKRLRDFADTWLKIRRNPDSITENALRTWFKHFATYARGANENKTALSFRLLLYPPSLAHYFDGEQYFFEHFDLWNDSVLAALGTGVQVQKHVAYQMGEWLFSVGTLVRRGHLPVNNIKKLVYLVDAVMNELSSVDPAIVTGRDLITALIGYRDTKKAVTGGCSLPENISTFLRQWCVILRQNEKNRPDASSTCSSIFTILGVGKLDATDELFDDVTKTFFWGLTYSKDTLGSCLYDYGRACCAFGYDPSRNSAAGDRAWPAWFRYAHEWLASPGLYSDPQGRDYAPRLLEVILLVASRFQRLSEFQRLRIVWEKRVSKELHRLKERDFYHIRQGIDDLENHCGILIDPKLCSTLKDLHEKIKQ